MERQTVKTKTQHMGFVVMTGLGIWVLGCAPAKVDAAPQAAAQVERATAPSREGKITAPVQLTFTSAPSAAKASSAGEGPVVLTLTVRALTDIPSGVARVVLPPQLKLLDGQREMPFGALAKDAERQFSLTIEVPPAGSFQIFAGVDCHISSGIQLHKEARPIMLGQPPASAN